MQFHYLHVVSVENRDSFWIGSQRGWGEHWQQHVVHMCCKLSISATPSPSPLQVMVNIEVCIIFCHPAVLLKSHNVICSLSDKLLGILVNV